MPKAQKGKKSVKKTTLEFKQEVYDRVNNEYIVLGEYEGTNKKIKMKHCKCGYEYEVTPNKFLQGRRCPNCNGTHKKNNTIFLKELNEKGITNIKLIGNYESYNKPLKIKNINCNHEYEMRPSDILRGMKCPICRGYIKNNKDFQNKLDSKKLEFDLISNYKNKTTPVLIRCRKCGFIKDILPDSIISNGTKCICETSSIPEKEIENFLIECGINHTRQQIFKNLKNRNYMPFDFMIPINGKILLIEYDGEFHFNNVYYNNNEEKFENRRKNDIIKNEFCIESNIQLLRIPYWSRNEKNKIIESVIKLLESSTTIQKWSTIEAYWKKETQYLLL